MKKFAFSLFSDKLKQNKNHSPKERPMTASEKPHVQINYNHFASFGFTPNGIEEQIYQLLCQHFQNFERREEIQPLSIKDVYSRLLQNKEEGEIVKGLEALKAGKGGHCIIEIKETGIMPGPCFGIVR